MPSPMQSIKTETSGLPRPPHRDPIGTMSASGCMFRGSAQSRPRREDAPKGHQCNSSVHSLHTPPGNNHRAILATRAHGHQHRGRERLGPVGYSCHSRQAGRQQQNGALRHSTHSQPERDDPTVAQEGRRSSDIFTTLIHCSSPPGLAADALLS